MHFANCICTAFVVEYRCNERAQRTISHIQKGRIMRISTTKYNEVNPAELKKLFENGAKLIKSPYAIGIYWHFQAKQRQESRSVFR